MSEAMEPPGTITRMGEALRHREGAAGRRVVRPGDVPWLPVEDWITDVVVSIDGNRVRLVALKARNPGYGAFTRLIAAIEAAGFQPVVVEPFPRLEKRLSFFGWRKRTIGSGVGAEKIMYPRRKKG